VAQEPARYTKRNRLIKFVAGRVGGVNLLRPAASELWEQLVREGATLSFPWKRAILGLPPELLDVESLAADYDPNRGTTGSRGLRVRGAKLTELCLRSPHLRPNHIPYGIQRPGAHGPAHRLFRTAKEGQNRSWGHYPVRGVRLCPMVRECRSEEELLSPLLLVPVRLDRETVESEFTLERRKKMRFLPNHCLAELLQSQFRIKLPTAAECPLDPENPDCLPNYLRAVSERVKHVPRWGVVESAALGVFNFQKLAMWEDLGRNAARVKATRFVGPLPVTVRCHSRRRPTCPPRWILTASSPGSRCPHSRCGQQPAGGHRGGETRLPTS